MLNTSPNVFFELAQEVQQVVHEPQYAAPQYSSVSPVVSYSYLPYAADYKYYYNWGQGRIRVSVMYSVTLVVVV